LKVLKEKKPQLRIVYSMKIAFRKKGEKPAFRRMWCMPVYQDPGG
jgi:hypothetical protein